MTKRIHVIIKNAHTAELVLSPKRRIEIKRWRDAIYHENRTMGGRTYWGFSTSSEHAAINDIPVAWDFCDEFEARNSDYAISTDDRVTLETWYDMSIALEAARRE